MRISKDMGLPTDGAFKQPRELGNVEAAQAVLWADFRGVFFHKLKISECLTFAEK